jgi:hypothetical protein
MKAASLDGNDQEPSTKQMTQILTTLIITNWDDKNNSFYYDWQIYIEHCIIIPTITIPLKHVTTISNTTPP